MIEFGVLGPVVVRRNGDPLPIGAAMLRKVLALLLCRVGEPLAQADLADALWDGQPPPTARKTLQVYVHRLRRILAADTTVRHGPAGYWVEVSPSELDSLRFADLLDRARAARRDGDLEGAGGRLRAALGLWRGEPYADAGWCPMLTAEANRLAEQRLQAEEERIAVDLDLGRHATLAGELALLTAAHPYREQLRVLHMLALYRAGRQAEALAVFRDTWTLLGDQLGIEPGSRLRRVHEAILHADERLSRAPVDEVDRLDRAEAPARPPPLPPDAALVPRQLPSDVAGFVGRAGTLAWLDELAAGDTGHPEPVRIAVLTGSAGVGKTALAVHWAHHAAASFPDGQLYVDLHGYGPAEPVSPVRALAELLRSLGVEPERVPVAAEEAATLYRSLLAGSRMLVVLDNAASAEQVRPLLPGGTGCMVVVTSRDRLAGLVASHGARRTTLDVLPLDEAVDLLVEVLGGRRPVADADRLPELARLCACLPLALRIAAANLACQEDQSVAEYVAALGGGDRLTDLEVAGDPQAAVRTAFHHSYQRLAAEVQRLFRRLGLVPGPDLTAPAAAALAAIPLAQADKLLDRLTGTHLLGVRAAGRFAFHDLLRSYASECAHQEETPAQLAAARQRLMQWYLRAADRAAELLYPGTLRLPVPEPAADLPPVGFADRVGAQAWLKAEWDNLLAAIVSGAEHGHPRLAYLLADAVRGFLSTFRNPTDQLAIARAGLAAARLENDLRAQATAELSIGDAYSGMGSYPQAIAHYTAANGLAREAGWLEARASTLVSLGNVYGDIGNLDQAIEHERAALELHRQVGSRKGQANAWGNLGNFHWERGDLTQAADCQHQALALYREIGNTVGEANSLDNLGEIAHAQGRLDHALAQLTRAGALHREVGDRYGEAYNLNCLAAVSADSGRLARALELAQAALALASEIGDPRTEADAHNTLGTIHLRQGLPSPAVDHHQRAHHIAQVAGVRYPEICALIGLSTVHREAGRPRPATEQAERALDLAAEAGYGLLAERAREALAAAVAAQPAS